MRSKGKQGIINMFCNRFFIFSTIFLSQTRYIILQKYCNIFSKNYFKESPVQILFSFSAQTFAFMDQQRKLMQGYETVTNEKPKPSTKNVCEIVSGNFSFIGLNFLGWIMSLDQGLPHLMFLPF